MCRSAWAPSKARSFSAWASCRLRLPTNRTSSAHTRNNLSKSYAQVRWWAARKCSGSGWRSQSPPTTWTCSWTSPPIRCRRRRSTSSTRSWPAWPCSPTRWCRVRPTAARRPTRRRHPRPRCPRRLSRLSRRRARSPTRSWCCSSRSCFAPAASPTRCDISSMRSRCTYPSSSCPYTRICSRYCRKYWPASRSIKSFSPCPCRPRISFDPTTSIRRSLIHLRPRTRQRTIRRF